MKNGILALTVLVSPAAAGVPAAAGSDAEFARAAGRAMAAAVGSAKAFAPRPVIAAEAPTSAPEGRLVSDKTSMVPVALNAQTVKCSAADYSMPMLKVLVPGLADLTLLNHRNTREGAPCVAAGDCRKFSPRDILGAGEGTVQVPVRVILRKLAEADGEVCRVTLIESVHTEIRGVAFFHERRHELAERVAEDCR